MRTKVVGDKSQIVVSIRTRPESRVMRTKVVGDKSQIVVSIRTRPESRVMRFNHAAMSSGVLFQSAPGPKAG